MSPAGQSNRETCARLGTRTDLKKHQRAREINSRLESAIPSPQTCERKMNARLCRGGREGRGEGTVTHRSSHCPAYSLSSGRETEHVRFPVRHMVASKPISANPKTNLRPPGNVPGERSGTPLSDVRHLQN